MINETNVLVLALIGGIVPALFWLWFWLREDRLRPEPKSALISAFVGGIIAVLLALFFELIIYYLLVEANPASIKGFPDFLRIGLQYFSDSNNLVSVQTNFWVQVQDFFNNSLDVKKGFLLIIIAPIVEEFLKLLLTYNICLRRKVNDEPIDASIYMLTAALGFAAIETALFLTSPLANGQFMDGFIAINFRSVGPMLIHLVSSATLGLFLGLSFYGGKIKKFFYLIIAFISAVFLHALFNFFIILNDATHNINYFWIACAGTWMFIIVLLIFFEKVKNITPPNKRFWLARKK
ncbi:MAG: PrsW family glutamic-type intramembrane protease [bacterium]